MEEEIQVEQRSKAFISSKLESTSHAWPADPCDEHASPVGD